MNVYSKLIVHKRNGGSQVYELARYFTPELVEEFVRRTAETRILSVEIIPEGRPNKVAFINLLLREQDIDWFTFEE